MKTITFLCFKGKKQSLNPLSKMILKFSDFFFLVDSFLNIFVLYIEQILLNFNILFCYLYIFLLISKAL